MRRIGGNSLRADSGVSILYSHEYKIFTGFPHDGAYHIYAEDWGKLSQGRFREGSICIRTNTKPVIIMPQ
jgi:hypothetical protein